LTQIEQWIKEEGREEGRKERDKEIVLAALKEGLSVDYIMKITGLDKRTIMEFKKSN